MIRVSMTASSESDPRAGFLGCLRESIGQSALTKLVLGKYRGGDPGLKRMVVRPLVVKGSLCLSFTSVYETRETVLNVPVTQGVERVDQLLGDTFRSAHLFSRTEDVQIEFSKRGKARWSRRGATPRAPASLLHNREKERFLDLDQPFLQALGITDTEHRLIPSMSRKWKQINKFLEIFDAAYRASCLSGRRAVRVVDFGSGKGYLTFAVHHYLKHTLQVEPQVTGIELRSELVRFCSGAASRLALTGLEFQTGDVRTHEPERLDVLIALHACYTATDLALHLGLRGGAEILLCAPCCHKEIRPQMQRPEVLDPVLRFGVHLGQEAEMVTDSLRALLLEANGYTVQVQEFVSLEHTSKNKMLLAVRHDRTVDRAAIETRIADLKAFYGIREQQLERLLKSGNP